MFTRKTRDYTPPNGYESVTDGPKPVQDAATENRRLRAELAVRDRKIADLQRENATHVESRAVMCRQLAALSAADGGVALFRVLYRAYDLSKQALMIADGNGRILYGNAAAEEMLGDVINVSAFHAFLDDLDTPYRMSTGTTVVTKLPGPPGHDLWEQVVAKSGSGYAAERVDIKDKEGVIIDVSLSMQLLIDDSGARFVLIELSDIGMHNKDRLTKLHNGPVAYRALKREVDARLALPDEAFPPLCVIYFDLDDFKGLNALMSDLGGDEVLKLVARVIAKHVKANPKNLACRWYSGDEYALIIHGPLAEAVLIAQAICDDIKRLRPKYAHPERGPIGPVNVSASIGVVEYDPGESVQEVISRAIERKNEAKAAGKGRVVPSPEDLRRYDRRPAAARVH